eukprot:COSAG06_NODE_5376_length_3516_cov_4.822359_1_plen_217_part_00
MRDFTDVFSDEISCFAYACYPTKAADVLLRRATEDFLVEALLVANTGSENQPYSPRAQVQAFETAALAILDASRMSISGMLRAPTSEWHNSNLSCDGSDDEDYQPHTDEDSSEDDDDGGDVNLSDEEDYRNGKDDAWARSMFAEQTELSYGSHRSHHTNGYVAGQTEGAQQKNTLWQNCRDEHHLEELCDGFSALPKVSSKHYANCLLIGDGWQYF